MKYIIPLKLCLILFFIMAGVPSSAQENRIFKTVEEYLTYIQDEFGIAPTDVYYVAQSTSDQPPKKVSAVMFFQKGEMAVIEDVVKVMANQCNPDRMMKKVTLTSIEKCMFKDPLANTLFTHMQSGKVYKPADGEMIAVFLLGHELGDAGQLYIKERKELENNLGIKTFIVTVDETYITELVKKRQVADNR